MSLSFVPGDLRRLSQRLAEIEAKDVPNVTRWGLNDMAFAVHRGNKDLMAQVFDRPTPFTLNAFYVKKATLRNLTAVIERKPMQRGRHYLEIQQAGGRRPDTGTERLLKSRLKYEGLIQSVVPTKNLRRNRYGNVSRAAMQRILSGVQSQGDRLQNTTAASRKRAGARRAQYFVPRPSSSLSPGVYERARQRIKKVLAFSDVQPNYSQQFPMEKNAHDVAAAAAPQAFRRAVRRAFQNG